MPRIDELRKLLEKSPNDAFVLYAMGQEYAKAGDYPSAIAHYDRCLQADPNYAYAYYHKARAQESAGDIDAAVRTLRDGIAASRHDPKAVQEMAASLDMIS